MTMVIFTNIILFFALSLWSGVHLLEAINEKRRPPLRIPVFLVPALAIIIIVFSFIPVGLIVESTAIMFGDSFQEVLLSVLFEYRIGQSFIVVSIFVVIALLARLTIAKRQKLRWLQMIPTLGIFVASSWSSHAASIADTGFYLNTVHFFAAALWAGALLISGFFSENGHGAWLAFFRWFTPFAIGIVLVMIGTGIGMMFFITPEYENSWLLTYGQMQLLKHMLFIPLLFYGFAHGFLMKRKISKGISERQVAHSLRMESILLLVIFVVTAGMIEQEPPHEVAQTVQYEEISSAAAAWITGDFAEGEEISWSLTLSTGLLIFAGLFILALFVHHVANAQTIWAVPAYVLLFLICIYAAVMLGAEKLA